MNELTEEETFLLHWMLGYAAGAMVSDKAISRERADEAMRLCDKVTPKVATKDP